jgi:hypothetical protein
MHHHCPSRVLLIIIQITFDIPNNEEVATAQKLASLVTRHSVTIWELKRMLASPADLQAPTNDPPHSRLDWAQVDIQKGDLI